MRDINLEDTIYPRFTTRAFATGIPTTLGGTPVLSVYEENNTTQITAGVSVSADYDSVTGLNQATIVATADNGYEAGKSYDVVITTGTVGGVSVVGEVVASFTVEDAAVITDVASVQSSVDNFAVGSASISTVAESYTLTTGTQSSGTFASTETRDGTPHQHTDTAGTTDLYYQFDVSGNGVATEFVYYGYLNGSNDSMSIQAYDWGNTTWDTIATLNGQNSTTRLERSWSALARHTGTGANLGKVRLRFYDTGLSSSTLDVDQLFVSYSVVAESIGYDGGQVWIDTGDGTAGTEAYVNGVADNPVLTLADAITIGSNIGLHRFMVSNESTITFAEAHANEVWSSNGGTMALGGQNVSSSHFYHWNDVSGTGTSATGEVHILDSHIANSTACTLGKAHITRSSIGSGGLVLSQAADYTIEDCQSGIAGSSAPTIDMGAAVGATNLSVRKWSGGITLNNLASGDVVTLEGTFGTVTLNGADASVEIRGIAKAVTNNLTGTPTVNDDTLKADSLESILVDTGTTIPATLGSPAGADMSTDIAAIDTVVDAVLVDTGTTIPASISALNDISAADVNAQMLDVMVTDTFAELASIPAATASLKDKITFLYMLARNQVEQTSTTRTIRADDTTTAVGTATVSDDGTTYTDGEYS